MRNVRKAATPPDRKNVVSGLQDVYDAEHLSDAKDAFRHWEKCWVSKYPNVVASIREDLGYLLAFYNCNKLHWEYLRTSNPIERVFRELRRQQSGCGAFANRDACTEQSSGSSTGSTSSGKTKTSGSLEPERKSRWTGQHNNTNNFIRAEKQNEITHFRRCNPRYECFLTMRRSARMMS